ncbi:MAG: inorganic phosphate transporter [Chloroflexi bacterium]|nr:inorganic phosphate transporter [Chloroflexota bacterium]
MTPTLMTMTLVIGVIFTFVNGLNNGSTLIAVASVGTGTTLLGATGALGVGLIIAPLLLGTRVATTIAGGLVAAQGASAAQVLLIGVAVAMTVVVMLNWRGLPTSLTLATVGGVVGAGAGALLPVAWGEVGLVVLLGVVAPLLVALGSSLLVRTVASLLSHRLLRSRLRAVSCAGFVLQALAYATNDGQRMLAVFAAGLGINGPVVVHAPELVGIALIFCAGAATGSSRVAQTLRRRLTLPSSLDALTAELASTISALAGSSIGVPVSMTQTTTAGLAGARSAVGWRRVRWEEAARLVGAWAITLPTSAVLAAGVAKIAVLTR